MKRKDLIKKIEAVKCRSAWARGVKAYALEMVEECEKADIPEDAHSLRALLMNGTQTWKDYSWGASSLIYDEDIARRLCTPSEFKKTLGGQIRPNKKEQWLDTQARALFQAELLIRDTIRD